MLEEKTSFWLKDGIHLRTEIAMKKDKKKKHYEIHTYEVFRNKISERYNIEAYENSKLLGKRTGFGGFNQTDKDKLIRALYLHFNYAVEQLKKGDIDKFKEFFTKLPESKKMVVIGK